MDEKIQESVAVFNGINIKISSLEDIWLSQKEIAQLFQTSVPNVSMHIKAIKTELAEWEGIKSTIKKSLIVQSEGERQVERPVELYGFEMICLVGYRVNGVRGVQFRQFATQAVMEKINRDLLNRDDETNRMHIENQNLKVKIGEAVMEISELEQQLEWQSQFVPDDADYGKISSNGFPRLTIQKGGYKSRGGKKVALKPQYVTIDLVAMAHYMLDK